MPTAILECERFDNRAFIEYNVEMKFRIFVSDYANDREIGDNRAKRISCLFSCLFLKMPLFFALFDSDL